MKNTNRNLWEIKSLDYNSLYKKFESIKNVVLYLYSEGYNKTEIGNYLGKSPQHINNILSGDNYKKKFNEDTSNLLFLIK